MSKFKLNSIMLVIAGSLSINATAEEKVPENDEIERIFIVGTKQDLTLQEVDASVELFSAERLSAEHIVDLNDALIRVPNLTSSGSTGSIAIRGIGRNGASGEGRGVTSNVYVDGSPLSGTALGRSLTSLWDVEQVEVLRGSQSSVQGRNALAGAIVVTTADPTYTPEGKLRLTYGENSSYQVAGAFSNAIIDEQLAFRVAVDMQESDGYIDHIYADKNADFEERLLLRGKLLFEPKAIDELSIKLTFDHNDTNIGEARPVVNTPYNVTDQAYQSFDVFNYISSGRYTQNDVQSTRFILDTHYALSNSWSITGVFTHENTGVDRQFGFPGLLEEFDGYAYNQFDEKVNTVEVRFNFDYENVSGVFGGYYFNSENDTKLLNEVLLGIEVARLTQGYGSVTPEDSTLRFTEQTITKTDNTALFAQVRIELDAYWTLDLGLRYDNEEFDNSGILDSTRVVTPDNCTASVPGQLIGSSTPLISLPCKTLVDLSLGEPAAEPPQTAKYDAWLPKLAITYKLNKDHSIFASAQRGYRAGGSYLTRIPNPEGEGNILTVDTYEPEYLNTIEIGSRSVLAAGDITFNTNIFYSKYKDQQVGLPGESVADATDDLIVNAAESSIYGVEVLFEYYISQEWDVFASIGLLKAEFDNFPYAEQGEFSNLAGNKQPSSPEASASVGANWHNQAGWFANLSVFYTGSRFSGVENLDNQDLYQVAIDAGVPANTASTLTEEIDAFVNANMRFGYEMDNFTFYAYATNLFDEEVVTARQIAGVDQETGEVTLSTGGTNSTILPPRTFGIGLDYEF
ncbi:MAG: TonB-dependent receptor [Colwellia sp.]|nr:TonB-dependent receptor [Colwellia sp.]